MTVNHFISNFPVISKTCNHFIKLVLKLSLIFNYAYGCARIFFSWSLYTLNPLFCYIVGAASRHTFWTWTAFRRMIANKLCGSGQVRCWSISIPCLLSRTWCSARFLVGSSPWQGHSFGTSCTVLVTLIEYWLAYLTLLFFFLLPKFGGWQAQQGATACIDAVVAASLVNLVHSLRFRAGL